MQSEKLMNLYDLIEQEVPFVDVKPYSRNIISIRLGQIAEAFGQREANEAIEHFGLEKLGWSKVNKTF